MRGLTMTCVTMLGAVLLAPACGAVLGIDDDRVLAGTEQTTSSSSSSASSSSSSSSSSSGAATPDAEAPAAVCNKECESFLVQGKCVAESKCEITCEALDPLCLNYNLHCPAGHDCVVKCIGKSCNGMSCDGGRSCTFDCTEAECKDTACNSETCTFRCGNGDSCSDNEDPPACEGQVRNCNVTCTGPGQSCKPRVRCCASATTTCPPSSTCDGD